ncbi:MAG: NAD(P)/FAD-dependent oxidoreductase [Deltaproteobacteria bacterium]|nr:NAD(P)/FAD-dependent oxidoreductase [Deltaproteobacteria bacterium]
MNQSTSQESKPIVIIGAGFTGLAAAFELIKRGKQVTILEKSKSVGGLAGGFDLDGVTVERFYHHWFKSDQYLMDLVKDIGQEENIIFQPTNTAIYYDKKIFRLSRPIDVLRFTPLGFLDRIRLGLLVFKVRAVKDWKQLESLTAKEWLLALCGPKVYQVVWEPLLVGKFGPFADQISAVWFWNKLVLRGGSRDAYGREVLAYYRGGFGALAEAITAYLRAQGAAVLTGVAADGLRVEDGQVTGVESGAGLLDADGVIITTPLPIAADLLAPHVPAEYTAKLRRIQYLANICLVLVLDKPLSETYWLNVNDPSFPFIGIIEHTNFIPPEVYGSNHLVYLSKYLPTSDRLYQMTKTELLDFTIPYLEEMFPAFNRDQVLKSYVWRADHAQPIVEKHYSLLVPEVRTPLKRVFISTMAQVYPEDRGTNYAIRDGKNVVAQT